MSLFSDVFVNGQGQSTLVYAVLAMLLYALHLVLERRDRASSRRAGDAFPSVGDVALPCDEHDHAGVHTDPRAPLQLHLWPVDDVTPAATRSGQ